MARNWAMTAALVACTAPTAPAAVDSAADSADADAAPAKSDGATSDSALTCQGAAAAKGSIGCRFWAVDLDNAGPKGGGATVLDAANAPFAVVLANPSNLLSAAFTITDAIGAVELGRDASPLDMSPIPPLGMRVLYLPPRNVDGTTLEPLAYRIDTTAPVAAYQFNPLETVNADSTDASLLLPEAALGTDYLAMGREQSFALLRGYVTVVATQAGATVVKLTFGSATGKTLAGTAKQLTGGAITEVPIASYAAGQTATFELQQGDVLNIETDTIGADLTGTAVHADKPVAVFSGSEGANAPNTNHCDVSNCTDQQLAKGDKCGWCQADAKVACNKADHCGQFVTCCADHLELQLPPVSAWGNDHVAVKFAPRGKEGDLWRIVAPQDGTQLQFDPPPKDTTTGKAQVAVALNAGQWLEIDTRDSFEIVSTLGNGKPAPVLVGHFMAGQEAPNPGAQAGDAKVGDPAMSLAIPRSQCQPEFVFALPPKFGQQWISVAGPSDASVAIDGVPVAAQDWQAVNAQFKFVRIALAAGTHRVTSLPVANGAPRNLAVEVYGYDQYVSFAYPAGMGLAGAATASGN